MVCEIKFGKDTHYNRTDSCPEVTLTETADTRSPPEHRTRWPCAAVYCLPHPVYPSLIMKPKPVIIQVSSNPTTLNTDVQEIINHLRFAPWYTVKCWRDYVQRLDGQLFDPCCPERQDVYCCSGRGARTHPSFQLRLPANCERECGRSRKKNKLKYRVKSNRTEHKYVRIDLQCCLHILSKFCISLATLVISVSPDL